MNQKLLHKIFAAVVFVVTVIVYFSTVQPTVSFWDCGEFIASSYLMQVPHPPGTPFFILMGRVFSMIPFFDNIGLRVNTISVLSSAFTIMFLYLIVVKLVKNYMKKAPENLFDAVTIYVSAAIGAFSLAFADTFWFNGVEAEVYANSTFFIALIVWLIMIWNEKADEPDNEKYLILIFYLIGLSTGVHLMSVLSIVSVVMIVIFRKYLSNEETLKQTAVIFVIQAAIILAIASIMWLAQTDSYAPTPTEYKSMDSRFLIILVIISALYMGALYKKIFVKNSFYIPLIIGGITLMAIYPGMVKYLPKIISAVAKNNATLDMLTLFAIFGLLGYGIYWSKKAGKTTLNLVFKSTFFAILGVTSYAMIIIRANQEPPINMNSPKNFTGLESYLNRDQYGDFPMFKRRYSNELHQQGIYTEYSSDFDFLWSYQINHMFNRYFFWNYIGRESTYQDSGVDWTDMFGIPFFIGLFGLYFHFKRDWKMATVFLVMFIFLGYLTAFYQNQQEPQPRERDYFYVGAFFVFSIWIAIGVRGMIELLKEYFHGQQLLKPVMIGVLAVCVIGVPVNMAHANWFEHNRSHNYVPWDYAYNLLQSVAPNAVLFTNGDNDTFPLWYLQDVEGVRRDVRIANLSLLNTAWYIEQLKNTTPFGTDKIKMSFTDDDIERLGLAPWNSKQMRIPVTPDIIKKYNITDSSVVKSGYISWTMHNTTQYGDAKVVRTQDLVVLDIIVQSQWERPIYFAVTCSEDSKIDLQNYLEMEGMALRVVPKKNPNTSMDYINAPIMWKDLMEEPTGFSKTYEPGFKFRGLNDKNIFFNENHERLVQNYRNSFMRLSLYYIYQAKDNKKAIEVLDEMQSKIPRAVIPMDYRIKHDVAKMYFAAGAMDKYKVLAKEVIATAKKQIQINPRNFSSYYNPYEILITHYENLKMYKDAAELMSGLEQMIPNDTSVRMLANKYRKLSGMDTLEIQQRPMIPR